jgi:3',5'-cyclic-AMP phosphodiesterase
VKRTYRILHLSDIHITADGLDMDGIDAEASLQHMLVSLRNVDALDVIIVSGDISDDGSEGGYSAALRQIGDMARERGIPQIYATGNHDDRAGFRAVLGSGHLSASGVDVGTLMGGSNERPSALSMAFASSHSTASCPVKTTES